MDRFLPSVALLALLGAAGCATTGRAEPHFAGHHHSGSQAASAIGLLGSIADLVGSIAEINARADDAEAHEAEAYDEWVQEQPDEAMPVARREIPHQPPIVTPADRPHTPFDAPAARQAIAAADVSSCIAQGAPAGYVHARVTFGGDGRVSAVGFDGAEMSAEATACLDDRLKGAAAPAFDGGPVTVGASVLLR